MANIDKLTEIINRLIAYILVWCKETLPIIGHCRVKITGVHSSIIQSILTTRPKSNRLKSSKIP